MKARKYLSSDFMIEAFGSKGAIAPEFVGTLARELPQKAERSPVFGAPSGTLKVNKRHSLIRRIVAKGIAPDAEILRQAVKTYLSVIAKIAAWWAVASVRRDEFESFRSMKIVSAENLIEKISEVKSGIYFEKRGIEFPPRGCGNREFDFHSEELLNCVTTSISTFAEVAPPTNPLDSDIFKQLYMDLMPRRLRHNSGEYYTPDWLADRVLEIAGYDGDPSVKLLDPACGSGAFMMRAVALLRKKCASAGLSSRETLDLISSNVCGLDLDPAAVLAAGANFLMAVCDLLPHLRGKLRLPVVCADSILEDDETLSKAGFSGAFDVVMGNPPWVNWESIDEEYRRKTKPLWKRHGLFPHSGIDTLLGKAKKDLSMLVTYRSMERFLRPKGVLAFIITRATLKSAGSGQGFRRFKLGDDTPVRPMEVDDLTEIKPFGSAAGSALIIALKKGEQPRYPVPYTLWKIKKGQTTPRDWSSLQEAKSRSKLIPLPAEPVDLKDSTSAWITADRRALPVLRKMLGQSSYTAHAGIYSGGANGVYWLRIIERRSDGMLLVENIPAAGKRIVEKVKCMIEPDLVYPLLRSGEVSKWNTSPKLAVLAVQDPERRRGMDEDALRSRYPKTWEYLSRFEKILRERAAWRRFFTIRQGDSYVEKAPFYSMFAVGRYTFASYKVMWPRMASSIHAAVAEEVGSKPVLPQETVTFVPLERREEAHYICALLNSTPASFAARAYSQVGGKGFASPHLLSILRIPQFDQSNENHQLAASISINTHKSAACKSEISSDFQEELDRLAARILGLSNKELEIIK